MKTTIATFAAAIFAGAIGSAAMAQTPYNGDITPTEIGNFNQFLDSHPQLAQRLAANPGLANNPQFLANHPGLQGFLASHPGVNEELHESPGQFMYREGHYQWSRGGVAPGAVARFDNGYLDQHPEVARQLAADPRLVDNPQFLATHPGLDQYFANHPEVRTELQQHPDRFMTDEWKFERREGEPHPLANTDRYFDQHPEVAAQLEKNPALVDNPAYVAQHPGLHEFLVRHPVARTEWKSHPYKYMSHEERYDSQH